MILARYIARRFLRSFAMVAGVFALILYMIETIEMIRRYSGAGVGLDRLAGLAAYAVVDSFYTITPLITALAAIALFLGLARTSEMVAIRASGRSALRMLAAPAITAALLGAGAVAVLNPLSAATTQKYSDARAALAMDGAQTTAVSDRAVWLRQGAATPGHAGEQTVIRARRASPDATVLYEASFVIFSPDTGPVRRIDAAQATLGDGAWHLTGVKDYPLDQPNPEAAALRRAALTLPSELTAQRIRDGVGAPSAVPVWQLPDFIAGLQRAGFDATRYRMWFQMELARPALMAAMVLIAAGFTLRHVRGNSTGMAALMAFGAAVALFFLRNMAQVLGDQGQIAPWLAAWAPPVVAMALALALILQREDG